MAIGKHGTVPRQLRTLFTIGRIGELSDGQLLERFATGRGEAAELAFSALVERHGPMVMRVSRSVLSDPHDAQDAFQATFLVLIKKARGLWVRDSLGPWLHQVAYRTAACARATEERRRKHERYAAKMAAVSPTKNEDWVDHDWEQTLHAEIERLPENYRVPIVLCDLEGRSHEQAARHMGWPIGTVKSRLSRGRERLRVRLRRRGLAPNACLLATALQSAGPDELIVQSLVRSTTGAAVEFVPAQTLAKGSAFALAKEALKAMSLSRWL
ncbi:MAG TPA: RNA polymerase sigma factor, partial [Isosphaeraceae bacterium]|nr:RNA polymerase sigma factor [Isosphaeraceae bacterium]